MLRKSPGEEWVLLLVDM